MNENSKKKRSVLRKYIRSDRVYSPQKLKIIRIRNHLTRKEVVAKTNINYSTLEKLETGRTKSPEVNTLFTLAELYNCCIGEFFNKQLDYIHCSKQEQTLIFLLRNDSYFDINKTITALQDKSEKGIIFRKFLATIFSMQDLPVKALEDIIRIHQDIKEFQTGAAT